MIARHHRERPALSGLLDARTASRAATRVRWTYEAVPGVLPTRPSGLGAPSGATSCRLLRVPSPTGDLPRGIPR